MNRELQHLILTRQNLYTNEEKKLIKQEKTEISYAI